MVIGASLLLSGLLVIAWGYIVDYKPYVSDIGNTFQFHSVAAFGYFPVWGGIMVLIFVISRGKCEWCGDLRGKHRLKCDLCGLKFCSSNCFYRHKDHKKCII